MTTPHQSPFVSYDAESVAAHERYRASLDRARQQRPNPERLRKQLGAVENTGRPIEARRVAQAKALGRRPVTPPPLTARDHLWLFVRSALAMGAVVAVLLALFWIGGGR